MKGINRTKGSQQACKQLLDRQGSVNNRQQHHVTLCCCAAVQVPLEFPDEPLPDVPLDCPSCQRAVCSTCRSKWHSGLVSMRPQAAALCSVQLYSWLHSNHPVQKALVPLPDGGVQHLPQQVAQQTDGPT